MFTKMAQRNLNLWPRKHITKHPLHMIQQSYISDEHLIIIYPSANCLPFLNWKIRYTNAYIYMCGKDNKWSLCHSTTYMNIYILTLYKY